MKDLYELLNEVNIDESEFKEMEVNDIEKMKLKKNLRKNIKKKNNWKKKTIVAATAIFVSTASFGIAFPSYAKNMPIVGDIFKAIDTCKTGIYDNFKENANEINSTKISNGIEITLNEIVFSGKSLTFTYTLKTDMNLGDYWTLCGEVISKGQERQGPMFFSSKHKKINKNTYVGMEDVLFDDFIKNPKDEISFNLKVNAIYYHDRESGESKPLEGDWNFNVNDLKSVKGRAETVNKSIENKGITVNIDEISKYPMSTFIRYSQKVNEEVNKKWEHITVFLGIKDDLGNVYPSTGSFGIEKNKNNLELSEFCGDIKKGAKKIILTPKVHFSNQDRLLSDSDFKGEEMKEINLDEIIIDLKK